MSEMTDDERDLALLERVAGGDMSAMRALYLTHSEAVQRFVRLRVHDDFDVADIVHDTFLSVWRGASGFQRQAKVRSWIFSIARNKAVDHIRRRSRVTLVEQDDTLPLDEPDVETVIAASQDARRVRACVDKLSERQRAVVHLAFYEDLTYAQIAEIEDTPEGTIKTRIFHAKKLLMRCLSASGK
jgi:RNA polymerase sigma-70 factor (ECF subfamily)